MLVENYITLKAMPGVPEGSEFIWNEEIKAYIYEDEIRTFSYLLSEIEQMPDWFRPIDVLDEFDDDPMMLVFADAKDAIDTLPMELVGDLFNYIQEKRLNFIEFADMKKMWEKEVLVGE